MKLCINVEGFVRSNTFPPLSHEICGSGSPLTEQLNNNGVPSLTLSVGGNDLANSGLHIEASSGGTVITW